MTKDQITMRRCARPDCGFEFAVNSKNATKKYCSDHCRELCDGKSKRRNRRETGGTVLYAAQRSAYRHVHPNEQAKLPEAPCKFRIENGRRVTVSE